MFVVIIHWKNKSVVPQITTDWNYLNSALDAGQILVKENPQTIEQVEIFDLDKMSRAALVFNSGRTFTKQEYQYVS